MNEQKRWDEARKEIAQYLTKQFVWYDPTDLPENECYGEADHILAMASICVLHPEQTHPTGLCPFCGKDNSEPIRHFGHAMYKRAEGDMLSQGWKRVLDKR